MPNFLVDLYPCVGKCGAKVAVRSLAEVPHAKCERCHEHSRHASVANMHVEAGRKHEAGAGVLEQLAAATDITRGAADAVRAALTCPDRAQAEKWANAARNWWTHAGQVLAKLQAEMEAHGAGEPMLRALGGGRSLEAKPAPPAPPPLDLPPEEMAALVRGAARWAAIRAELHFRKDVEPPASWAQEVKDRRRWAFTFQLRGEGGFDAYLWEDDTGCNLVKYRVAPPLPTRPAALAWALAFARYVGFPALEKWGKGGFREIRPDDV